VVLIIVVAWVFYRHYQQTAYINKIISNLKDKNRLDNTIMEHNEKDYFDTSKKDSLKWKLLQAGMDQNEYFQTKLAIYAFGLIMVIFPFFFFELSTSLMIAISGVLISIFAPALYLDSAKSERVKKVDHDLSSFLDLIIIILESGGGLKNSLNFVADKADNILSPILINEIKTLEAELSNYDSSTAYDNLAKRTGSKYIISMVDFLKLAEETGMGVKTIFENQAKEIKDAEFFEVEKKAATVNLSLTLVVFLFLLPALAAFIVLPMRAGDMMGGF
jgi:tight adherence protein C